MGSVKIVSGSVARWTHDAPEGSYLAGVKRERAWDRYEDGATRYAWRWFLEFAPKDGEPVRVLASRADAITTPAHAPDHDHTSAEVLATLASFVSAWDEAQGREGSENRDLFPATIEPWLGAAEEFCMDLDEYDR